MAFDLSTLTDYSWSQIKVAAKNAMVNSALGGSRLVIEGRDITRISISEATKLYTMACEMELSESGNSNDPGDVLIDFGDL